MKWSILDDKWLYNCNINYLPISITLGSSDINYDSLHCTSTFDHSRNHIPLAHIVYTYNDILNTFVFKALLCTVGKKIYFDVSEILATSIWTEHDFIVETYRTILISHDVLTMLTTTMTLDGNIDLHRRAHESEYRPVSQPFDVRLNIRSKLAF